MQPSNDFRIAFELRDDAAIQSTVIIAVAFVLLWNSGFIGAEFGLPYAGPFTLLFWRYAALSLILLLYLKVRRRALWHGWDRAGPAFVMGALAHGAWLGCVLYALQAGVPAGIVALVVALQPLATGCLSGTVTGERTSPRQWLGLLIGFTGVAIPVLSRIGGDQAESLFGLLIPFGSVIAMTAATLIGRRLELENRDRSLPLDMALFYQSAATLVVVALPAIFLEDLSTDWNPVFNAAMIWLVVGVSLGAYALMWLLLRRLDAVRVASLFYLGPPVTMVMAWIAFGDLVTMLDLVGLSVVAAGVLIVQKRRRYEQRPA